MDRKAMHDVWTGMHQRCANPKHISFQWYGAKGISVCDRWGSFDAFIADMGPRPSGFSLDRIDSTKPYEPSNCRWASAQTQNSNKSDTVLIERDGVVKTMSTWGKVLGISPQTLHYRIRKLGIDPALALSLPVNRHATRRALKEIK